MVHMPLWQGKHGFFVYSHNPDIQVLKLMSFSVLKGVYQKAINRHRQSEI